MKLNMRLNLRAAILATVIGAFTSPCWATDYVMPDVSALLDDAKIQAIVHDLRELAFSGVYEGTDSTGKKCQFGIQYKNGPSFYSYMLYPLPNVGFYTPQGAEGGAILIPYYSYTPQDGDKPGSVEVVILNSGGFGDDRYVVYKILAKNGVPISISGGSSIGQSIRPGSVLPALQIEYPTCTNLVKTRELP